MALRGGEGMRRLFGCLVACSAGKKGFKASFAEKALRVSFAEFKDLSFAELSSFRS